MEEELLEAMALYQENILAVQGSLEYDPHNPELFELVQELREALAGAQQALAGLQAAANAPVEADGGSAVHRTAAHPEDPKNLEGKSTLAGAVEEAAEAAATETAAHLAPWPDGSILDPWPLLTTSQLGIGPQLPLEWALQQECAPKPAHLVAAEADASSQSPVAALGTALHAAGHGTIPQVSPAAPDNAGVGRVLRPAAAAAAAAAAASLRPQMHPRNKYATELPDFGALAEKYPRLLPYLQRRGGPCGRPSLDFTDPRACRELTRALLWHDFGVDWWLPEGQLVPPVTNRANYIHWLEDLLELSPPPGMPGVVGLDIGCGANLIYPLLGASIAGWRFVAVDVTEEAFAWAAANRTHNPRLAPLIEVRRVGMQAAQRSMMSRLQQAKGGGGGSGDRGGWVGEWGRGRTAKRARREQQQQQRQQQVEEPALQPQDEQQRQLSGVEEDAEQHGERGEVVPVPLSDAHPAAVPGRSSDADAAAPVADGSFSAEEGSKRPGTSTAVTAADGTEGSAADGRAASRLANANSNGQQPPPVKNAAGSGILSGAVRQGERFAFCMCNPPFFDTLEEAGRNPATAFSGTAAEMVYPGGELAFVEGMVEDSFALQGQIHWYTTMVGKKVTLKAVRALLYRRGVRVLRTTEFVQGKTSRWAIAWSFTVDPNIAQKPLPRPVPAAHPAV